MFKKLSGILLCLYLVTAFSVGVFSQSAVEVRENKLFYKYYTVTSLGGDRGRNINITAFKSSRIFIEYLIVYPDYQTSMDFDVGLYSKDTFLAVDQIYSNTTNVANLYHLTKQPYDDRDSSSEVHIRIYNDDPTPTAFYVTIAYRNES